MTVSAAPTTLKTGHVGLNVSDLDRSIDFYTRAFGLQVQTRGNDQDRHFAFLARDGRLVLTLWQQSSGRFATDRPGLHHLSFQVDTIDEVEAAQARLREMAVDFAYDGIVPHAEGADSGGVFFTDPDGIRLEISAPAGAGGAPAPNASAPTCGFF